MNMRIAFGQLLLNVSERLRTLAKRLGVMDTGPESTTGNTLVWGVLEGPYSREDFPEEELEDMGIPLNWNWMIVAKVQEGSKMGTINLWYDTLDEALDVVNYFKKHIEPLEIENGA